MIVLHEYCIGLKRKNPPLMLEFKITHMIPCCLSSVQIQIFILTFELNQRADTQTRSV